MWKVLYSRSHNLFTEEIYIPKHCLAYSRTYAEYLSLCTRYRIPYKLDLFWITQLRYCISCLVFIFTWIEKKTGDGGKGYKGIYLQMAECEIMVEYWACKAYMKVSSTGFTELVYFIFHLFFANDNMVTQNFTDESQGMISSKQASYIAVLHRVSRWYADLSKPCRVLRVLRLQSQTGTICLQSHCSFFTFKTFAINTFSECRSQLCLHRLDLLDGGFTSLCLLFCNLQGHVCYWYTKQEAPASWCPQYARMLWTFPFSGA